MYENIGGKIKVLAKVIAIIQVVAVVITGLNLLEATDGFSLLILLVGPVFAWISTWLLYGFGELVENSGTLVEMKSASLAGRPEQQPGYNQQTAYGQENTYVPPVYQPPYGGTYSQQPAQPYDSIQNQAASVGNEWRCTCGRVNATYVSTCTCGVNKRDIKKQL